MTAISTIVGQPLHSVADTRFAKHIAFVLAGLSAGGAERVVSLISTAWAAQGHRVTIITFDHAHDACFHRFDPRVTLLRLGIPPLNSGGIGSLVNFGRRVRALRRVLHALHPDVTISFLTKINVLTLLACLGTRQKVVISERNNPRAQQKNPIWKVLFRCLSWRAAAIVMQTLASVDCLHPQARRRARVIGNPVALEPIGQSRIGPPALVAVGRLTSQKGFDMLIEAFKLIADRHLDWNLVIWGEGEDREVLERQIAESGYAQRILLPGRAERPEDWVAMATVFVLSSRYEGFPNVLAEAMMGGLPVAAFNCEYGPADMISHDYDGLLVPGKDIAGLAAAIDRLMGDSALRARLGQAAREISARNASAKIVAYWDNVVAEVVAR